MPRRLAPPAIPARPALHTYACYVFRPVLRRPAVWLTVGLLLGVIGFVGPSTSVIAEAADEAGAAAKSAADAKSSRRAAGPLSPAALEAMQLAPGLRIELAASEPQVTDPVEIRFDERGRLWVVQMTDYPHGPPEGSSGLCQIRLLEDRDGDGFYETAAVFADKLLFATGLQPWQSGVIVTHSGRLSYFPDDDGDGRADREEVWYTGFAEQNSQLRANHPRWGLDNHIYVANGLRTAWYRTPAVRTSRRFRSSGMDFRFEPRSGRCEL